MTAKLIVHQEGGAKIHEYDSLKSLGDNLVEIFRNSVKPDMITMISMDREGGELTVRIKS